MTGHAPEFDVFLSYNSQDEAAVQTVREIAQQLREKHLRPYFDQWYLEVGQPWMVTLEETLCSCRSIAIVKGGGGLGSWQQRERQLALARQDRDGTPVIPVLLPGADPGLDFLMLNTWVDFRRGTADPRPWGLFVGKITGRPPQPDLSIEVAREDRCPYRGLHAFREEDAPFFFGRAAFTERLAAAVVGPQPRNLVALIGNSGSGKSSVVRAGLVPQLRRRNDGGIWDVVTLVPTDRPFHALAAAWLPLLAPKATGIDRLDEVNRQANALRAGALQLRDLVEQALREQPGTDRLLLVIDQWEELYTLCREDRERRAFIAQILDATERSALAVVLTLRADFLGRIDDEPGLSGRLRGAEIYLGAMNEVELRQTIEQPAQQVDLEFENGLVDGILADVSAEPGNLPLLEFVLARLWAQRRGKLLLHAAYRAMGGARGAIARRADEVFASLADREDEVRRIFLRLVRPGEGTADSRRRVPAAALGPSAGPIVERLVQERLLVTGRDLASGEETVEVAHEALLGSWDQLRTWLDQNRKDLLLYEPLRQRADEWHRLGREAGSELRGHLLALYEDWAKTQTAVELSEPEQAFLAASLAQREREEEEKRQRREEAARQAQQQAENERRQRQEAQRRAQQEAEAARRLRRRSRWLIAGLAVAVICTGVAFYFYQREERERTWAEAQSRIARARELAAQSVMTLDSAPQLSLLLAVAAVRTAPDVLTAHAALRQGLSRIGGTGFALGLEGVNEAAFSSDGSWLAVLAGGRDPALFRVAPGALQPVPLAGGSDRTSVLAFSPDGRRFGAGTHDGQILVWDLPAPWPARVRQGSAPGISALSFSRDGQQIVAADAAGAVELWDLPPRGGRVERRAEVSSDLGAPFAAGLGADRRWLFAGAIGGAWLFNFASRRDLPLRLVAADSSQAMLKVRLSPDGGWLATCRSDGIGLTNLRLPDPGSERLDLPGSQGGVAPVTAAAWSADSRRFATGGRDGTVRLWTFGTSGSPPPPLLLRGARGEVEGLAFSHAGQWLAAASEHRIHLWNLAAADPGKEQQILEGYEAPIAALTFSLEDDRLTSLTRDGNARQCDLAAGSPTAQPRVLPGHAPTLSPGERVDIEEDWRGAGEPPLRLTQPARSPARHLPAGAILFSPKGSWLLNGLGSEAALLWSLGEALPLAKARPMPIGAVRAAAFRPDERWLATGGEDGLLRFWDLNAAGPRPQARTSTGHGAAISALELSPRGRWLVSGDENGEVRLWDLADREGEGSVLKTGGRPVRALRISPQGRWLLALDETSPREIAPGRKIHLWDLESKNPADSPLLLSAAGPPVVAAAFSADERWLAVVTGPGEIQLWNLKSGGPQERLILPGKGTGAAMSPDGRWLLIGNDSGAPLDLWELGRQEPQRRILLAPARGPVRSASFSSDSRWLATGIDSTGEESPGLYLWDLRSEDPGAGARALPGQPTAVSLAFSPDGRWLLTGDRDGVSRLWDLRAADPHLAPLTLDMHAGRVATVAFSPDGRFLATADFENTVQLWTFPLDDLVQLACRTAGRNLTQREGKKYFGDPPYPRLCAGRP